MGFGLLVFQPTAIQRKFESRPGRFLDVKNAVPNEIPGGILAQKHTIILGKGRNGQKIACQFAVKGIDHGSAQICFLCDVGQKKSGLEAAGITGAVKNMMRFQDRIDADGIKRIKSFSVND